MLLWGPLLAAAAVGPCLLADDGLPVFAGHVVELDPVLVEVVENAQAALVPLPVVGLGPAQAGKERILQLKGRVSLEFLFFVNLPHFNIPIT